MEKCLELIYDRFGIEFYSHSGVEFKQPMQLCKKMISASDVVISEEGLYLQVGHYPKHTGKQIRSNDTADNVTSSVSEDFDNGYYTVNVHFEFSNPDTNSVNLCQALDTAPFHVILVSYALDGRVTSRRIIRNEEGQSLTFVTESNGIVSVDMTIVNPSGIQLIG